MKHETRNSLSRMVIHVLVFTILALGNSVHAVPAPTGSFTFTFRGSADGSTFDILTGNTTLPGIPGANSTFVLQENEFGNFIIPGLGPTSSVSTGSGQINSSSTGNVGLATGIQLFDTGLNRLSFTSSGNPAIIPIRSTAAATISGSITDISVSALNIPGVSTFEQLFNIGTFSATPTLGLIGPTYSYILIFESGINQSTTNLGAIMSVQTTGLTSISTGLTNLQNVTQSANRDLNSRLFRARSGVNRPDPNTVSTLDGDSSRYLDFAARQGIDSRVALGLADGVEVPASAPVSGTERTGATITVPIGGSAKAPLDGKIVINDRAPSRFEVFTEFDFGYYDQDDLSTAARGFDSNTFGSTLGAEYRVSDNLHAGVAVTHQTSDAEITGGLGSSDLEGQIFSTYFTTFRGNTFFDFLYSYGDFENDIARNTLLGSFARGDTDSDSHNLSLNTGTLYHRTESFSYGPIAAFDYATGTIDGYTETGGGSANLVVPDHDFESAVTRLGGVVNFYYDTKAGNVTSQLRAAWAHEFSPEDGVVTAALQTSPFALNSTPTGGFTASQNRGRIGTDWLEIGATTRVEFENAPVHLELGYQGMLGRDRAVAHFGSVRLGYAW